MSTYYGYECRSHTPPLTSEQWLNHGGEILDQTFVEVRCGRWPKVDIRSERTREVLWTEDAPLVFHDIAWTEPVAWLRLHPDCEIWVVSEEGDGHRANDLLKTIEPAPPRLRGVE